MLTALHRGLPRTHTLADGSAWRTGYVKEPVWDPVWLTRTGLEGDGVGSPDVHGGVESAICAYCADHFPAWREELPHLAIDAGAFGENFTLRGLTEQTACVGDVYEAGEALVQISKPRMPCSNIAKRWNQPDFVKRVHTSRRSGWYMRVLREGHVAAPAPFTLIERPCPDWSVQRVYDLYERRREEPEAIAELAKCEQLAADWRREMMRV